MDHNGSRNFLSRFLLKQYMKDEQMPLAVQTFESCSSTLPQTQATTQEAGGEMELVRRSCAGDQDAFAVLVRNHQRRAFVLALRMLNNYDEACEAVQEAFLAAWQGLHTFRGEARFSTWLYRVVYHCCLRVLEQRRRDSRDLDAATAQAEHRAVLEAGQEIQSLVTDRERQETIQRAIQELPGKYRAVLILRHLQELTYEEIAQALSLPVGTIKTHLFRARNLLKERLQLLDRDELAPAAAASSPPPQPSTAGEESSVSLLARLTPPFLHLGPASDGERRDR
jgi:RNA polymerase sigma-70 factor (ECF subfamily)